MRGYCKVIILGSLTRDVELRYTPKGTAIAKLGVAINREWTQDGEKKSETTFLDVDAFGKTAETLAQFLKKGSPIFCEARPKLDSWDDKQTGQKRSKIGFVLETFQFLPDSGGTREGGEAPARPRPDVGRTVSNPAPARQTPADVDSAPPESDDSVPF